MPILQRLFVIMLRLLQLCAAGVSNPLTVVCVWQCGVLSVRCLFYPNLWGLIFDSDFGCEL